MDHGSPCREVVGGGARGSGDNKAVTLQRGEQSSGRWESRQDRAAGEKGRQNRAAGDRGRQYRAAGIDEASDYMVDQNLGLWPDLL